MTKSKPNGCSNVAGCGVWTCVFPSIVFRSELESSALKGESPVEK